MRDKYTKGDDPKYYMIIESNNKFIPLLSEIKFSDKFRQATNYCAPVSTQFIIVCFNVIT